MKTADITINKKTMQENQPKPSFYVRKPSGDLQIFINDLMKAELVRTLSIIPNKVLREKMFFAKYMPEYEDITCRMQQTFCATILKKDTQLTYCFLGEGSFIDKLINSNFCELTLLHKKETN